MPRNWPHFLEECWLTPRPGLHSEVIQACPEGPRGPGAEAAVQMRLGGFLTAATSLTVQCGPLRGTGQ